MEFFAALVTLVLGAVTVNGSVKVITQGNEALVETLGRYSGRKLKPGINFVWPFLDRVAYRETIREKVLDIPPQQCFTRDNVSVTVDAVVYWRILDMEKACYKVEDLQLAMVNLVLTQIRAEMGKLELDETFTARGEINETLLRELDIATDPWGVKVTRVELRDLVPSKAVQDAMELQMGAERQRRAAILTSEGQRDSAVNVARGQADAQLLEAEANKRATILQAEAEQQAVLLKAEADRQKQVLQSKGTAESMAIVAQTLKGDTATSEALQFLLAQNYLEMGITIGSSDSSKVMFMDPHNIPAVIEGMRAIVSDSVPISQSIRGDRLD